MKHCIWIADEDGTWTAECGMAQLFNCDGPVENGYNFCPRCGKPIELQPFVSILPVPEDNEVTP